MRTTTSNLGFLLVKAAQHWNDRLAERFAAGGFPEVRPSYGSVLLPLFEQDRLRMSQLADRARLSKQSITKLVRLCEGDGLVERERDRDDRRAFRVALTPRAREFQLVAERALGDLEQRTLATFGRREHDVLSRALKGVLDL